MFFAKILISRLPFRGHSGGGDLRRSHLFLPSLGPGVPLGARDIPRPLSPHVLFAAEITHHSSGRCLTFRLSPPIALART